MERALLGMSLDKSLVPNLAFWRACFPELADAEFRAKIVGAPRQLVQSHGRLQERAALFDAQGVSRSLLWCKAHYTNAKLKSWLAKHQGAAQARIAMLLSSMPARATCYEVQQLQENFDRKRARSSRSDCDSDSNGERGSNKTQDSKNARHLCDAP